MADIAKRTTDKNNRVLFLVHRKELIEQAEKTFKEQRVDMRLVQFSMIQSAAKHLKNLYPAKLIFVDEGHHSMAKSYLKVLDHFNESFKLLFTATPWRSGKGGFTEIADDLIVGRPISWFIKKGYMADFDYYAPNEIDTEKLKVSQGDFSNKSINEALKHTIYGDAVKYYKQLAAGKQAIVYTHSVESAYKVAEEFNKSGIKAKALDGSTESNNRERVINDYRNGKLTILVNRDLFTEGLDLPNVDCVIQLRPTKSLALFLQFSMRCLNPRENKKAIIIDHVNNVGRFGLPDEEREWNLSGKHSSELLNPIKTCPMCFGTFYKKDVKKNLCPYCGSELTSENAGNSGKAYEIKKDAKLAKVNRNRLADIKKEIKAEIASHVPSDWHDAKSQAQLEEYAKIHGYKHGWAYFKARSMHLL
nr:DEAD/DEAH box helicase [Oenococcus oeni]